MTKKVLDLKELLKRHHRGKWVEFTDYETSNTRALSRFSMIFEFISIFISIYFPINRCTGIQGGHFALEPEKRCQKDKIGPRYIEHHFSTILERFRALFRAILLSIVKPSVRKQRIESQKETVRFRAVENWFEGQQWYGSTWFWALYTILPVPSLYYA